MFKFISALVITYLFSAIIDGILNWWQSIPIKEEKSMPLYITKQL